MGDRLAYLFKRARVELVDLHEELLAPFEIDAGQLGVLMFIGSHEAESQQQVAQRIGVDRTTMVDVVDELEGKGLVERRGDPADRRRKVLELTAKGKRTLTRATRASDQAEARLLADLDEDERAVLRDLMRRIARVPGGQPNAD